MRNVLGRSSEALASHLALQRMHVGGHAACCPGALVWRWRVPVADGCPQHDAPRVTLSVTRQATSGGRPYRVSRPCRSRGRKGARWGG
jgi:hypothetical protein